MKAPRTIAVRFIASLGLMLVFALAFQRLRRPLPSPAGSDRGAVKTSRSVVRPAAAQREERPGSASQTDADGTAAGLPKSAFLRGLVATMASIRSEPDAAGQEEKLETLADEIASSHLPEALAFLQQQGTTEWNQALGARLVRRWAEHSPQAAADWALRTPAGPMRREAIQDAAIAWANADLAGAVEWARQLPADPEQQSGLLSIA